MSSLSSSIPVIYFLQCRNVLNSVFQSAVLTPAAILKRSGHAVSILMFHSIKELFGRAHAVGRAALRENLKDLSDVDSHQFLSFPQSLIGARDGVRLARWLAKRHPVGVRIVLHCRGLNSTLAALECKKYLPSIRVVYDMRGLLYAERAYLKNIRDVRVALDSDGICRSQYEAEKSCAHEADAIVCVSHAMYRHVLAEFGVESSKMSIIPCCVDMVPYDKAQGRRTAIRSRLGLEDRFVVTYCGTCTPWQLPDQCARIFGMILASRPAAHFLILTPDGVAMREVLSRAGLSSERVTVIHSPSNRIPEFLAAADLGLLIRENDLMNHVSSPVKFGEYMAAGLPTVITPGVGDYTESTRTDRLGLVLKIEDPDATLRQALDVWLKEYDADPKAFRDRCRYFASQHLSWTVMAERLAATERAVFERDCQ